MLLVQQLVTLLSCQEREFGELAGLRGTGSFVAKHAEYSDVPFTLDYHFE